MTTKLVLFINFILFQYGAYAQLKFIHLKHAEQRGLWREPGGCLYAGKKAFFMAGDINYPNHKKICEIDMTTDAIVCLNQNKVPEEYCSNYFIVGSNLYYTTQPYIGNF